MSGVPGDTWPSAWAADGGTYAMGCDNKPPGKDFAWMNWWTVKGGGNDGSSEGKGSETDRSSKLNLTLIDNFPVKPNDMLNICGQYFENDTSKGNIKPTSVLAVGATLYAAVQCITYVGAALSISVHASTSIITYFITSIIILQHDAITIIIIIIIITSFITSIIILQHDVITIIIIIIIITSFITSIIIFIINPIIPLGVAAIRHSLLISKSPYGMTSSSYNLPTACRHHHYHYHHHHHHHYHHHHHHHHPHHHYHHHHHTWLLISTLPTT
jgi:hypothetical protein